MFVFYNLNICLGFFAYLESNNAVFSIPVFQHLKTHYIQGFFSNRILMDKIMLNFAILCKKCDLNLKNLGQN